MTNATRVATYRAKQLAKATAQAKRVEELEAVVAEANNSLYGSQGAFLSLNGGPSEKYHLSRPIERLKERSNRFWRALDTIANCESHFPGDVVDIARQALEGSAKA